MPWHWEPMKDVISCDKLRGAANKLSLIHIYIVPTFLNTASVTNGGLNYDQKQQLKTKRLLAAQGFYEASTCLLYTSRCV